MLPILACIFSFLGLKIDKDKLGISLLKILTINILLAGIVWYILYNL